MNTLVIMGQPPLLPWGSYPGEYGVAAHLQSSLLQSESLIDLSRWQNQV
jgi:hypothetical protein